MVRSTEAFPLRKSMDSIPANLSLTPDQCLQHKYATHLPLAHFHYCHECASLTLLSPSDGGACVAMVGKDCVAIACDLRLGVQALTVSNNFPKIFRYGEDVFLGLTGLATDVATVSDLFRYKVNMYRLREERSISPQTMANLVSTSLYEKRFGPFFVSPIIAGINHTTGKPFICGFDSIGCIDFAKDFIVSGTASDQLFGTCEGLWEPDLVCLGDFVLRLLRPFFSLRNLHQGQPRSNLWDFPP